MSIGRRCVDFDATIPLAAIAPNLDGAVESGVRRQARVPLPRERGRLKISWDRGEGDVDRAGRRGWVPGRCTASRPTTVARHRANFGTSGSPVHGRCGRESWTTVSDCSTAPMHLRLGSAAKLARHHPGGTRHRGGVKLSGHEGAAAYALTSITVYIPSMACGKPLSMSGKKQIMTCLPGSKSMATQMSVPVD